MPVYGDDPSTEEKEGAVPGDTISFKAWDSSEGCYINLYPQGPDSPIWSDQNITLPINLTTSSVQQIHLCRGWNLISFQINNCYFEIDPTVFIPENTRRISVDSMLEWFSDDSDSPIRDDADPDKAGDWQRIISFDQEGAHILDKDLPSPINTLKYISAGYGYWIKMNVPGTLFMEGPFIPINSAIQLNYGWNLVGYIPSDVSYGDINSNTVCPYITGAYSGEDSIIYNQVDTPVTDCLLGGIYGTYRHIIAFDQCSGAMLYDRQLPVFINTLHYMGPKYGYWIKIEDHAGAELIFSKGCSGQ